MPGYARPTPAEHETTRDEVVAIEPIRGPDPVLADGEAPADTYIENLAAGFELDPALDPSAGDSEATSAAERGATHPVRPGPVEANGRGVRGTLGPIAFEALRDGSVDFGTGFDLGEGEDARRLAAGISLGGDDSVSLLAGYGNVAGSATFDESGFRDGMVSIGTDHRFFSVGAGDSSFSIAGGGEVAGVRINGHGQFVVDRTTEGTGTGPDPRLAEVLGDDFSYAATETSYDVGAELGVPGRFEIGAGLEGGSTLQVFRDGTGEEDVEAAMARRGSLEDGIAALDLTTLEEGEVIRHESRNGWHGYGALPLGQVEIGAGVEASDATETTMYREGDEFVLDIRQTDRWSPSGHVGFGGASIGGGWADTEMEDLQYRVPIDPETGEADPQALAEAQRYLETGILPGAWTQDGPEAEEARAGYEAAEAEVYELNARVLEAASTGVSDEELMELEAQLARAQSDVAGFRSSLNGGFRGGLDEAFDDPSRHDERGVDVGAGGLRISRWGETDTHEGFGSISLPFLGEVASGGGSSTWAHEQYFDYGELDHRFSALESHRFLGDRRSQASGAAVDTDDDAFAFELFSNGELEGRERDILGGVGYSNLPDYVREDPGGFEHLDYRAGVGLDGAQLAAVGDHLVHGEGSEERWAETAHLARDRMLSQMGGRPGMEEALAALESPEAFAAASPEVQRAMFEAMSNATMNARMASPDDSRSPMELMGAAMLIQDEELRAEMLASLVQSNHWSTGGNGDAMIDFMAMAQEFPPELRDVVVGQSYLDWQDPDAVALIGADARTLADAAFTDPAAALLASLRVDGGVAALLDQPGMDPYTLLASTADPTEQRVVWDILRANGVELPEAMPEGGPDAVAGAADLMRDRYDGLVGATDPAVLAAADPAAVIYAQRSDPEAVAAYVTAPDFDPLAAIVSAEPHERWSVVEAMEAAGLDTTEAFAYVDRIDGQLDQGHANSWRWASDEDRDLATRAAAIDGTAILDPQALGSGMTSIRSAEIQLRQYMDPDVAGGALADGVTGTLDHLFSASPDELQGNDREAMVRLFVQDAVLLDAAPAMERLVADLRRYGYSDEDIVAMSDRPDLIGSYLEPAGS